MNIFQDYYEAKLALDILAKEVEEKKEAIAKALLSESDNKVIIAGAKFHLKRDFIYEFSDKAQLLEEKTNKTINGFKETIKTCQSAIKDIKAQEIEDGTATLIETRYTPVMTIIKE